MKIPLFSLGFRPFFLLGSLFSAIAMGLWIGPWFPTAMIWHAHEMIFGFGAAIIAGFLLTAVRNWTAIQTLRGWRLLALSSLWLGARLFALREDTTPWGNTLDLMFLLFLLASVSWPVYQARQWRQWGVLICLALIFSGQLVYFLGTMEIWGLNPRWGIQTGLFAILGLIFIITRRVIPFFTERGVGYPVTLTQYPWLDRWLMPLFTAFAALEIIFPGSLSSRLLALTLGVAHLIRLNGWYTCGIWQKPLLWILFVAYGWLILGFLLYALALSLPGLHALAVGGMGGVILGMICRVSLGHTGRNIHEPPQVVSALFLLLFTAALSRSVLPSLLAEYTLLWYRLAGIAWIMAFLGFVSCYGPMLWLPRADGRPD